MLKKNNRLSNFKINARRKDIDTPLFKIKIFIKEGEDAKFGFIVSKKIDKRAVIRNKTKRVLKSIIKNILPELENKYKMIIIAKTKLDFTKKDQAEKEVRMVFKKTGLL